MEKEETQKSDVALREEAVFAFWEEHDIFNKSLEKDAPNGDFVFYDGPPFATGLPHYGHILASAIKDAIPRFWTMNGYRVARKWGWDCHGLPLENLIEKKLGLATKRDIEEYGIKNFNEAARDTVMEYADEWARIIPRMGRFADMENDYKTMDSSYTESVWWVFHSLYEKGLVYEGFKSMHLCPRCGTTLSNFEVNQGYKDIKDIAVTVKLPLVDEPGTSLLVWTTTPWTLPGNMAAAVHKEADYVKVTMKTETGDEQVILAKGRLEQLGDIEHEVVAEMKGADLVGKSYEPPFPYFKDQEFENKNNAWKIYHADYVEVGEEGTGAVHLAPAYGDEDMELAKAEGVPIIHHVSDSGHFKDFVTDFAGQLVKPKDDDKAEVSHLDADIEIVRALNASGRLLKKENITHSYPHCWRCDTPLLNYATTSWFVEVTKIRDELVAENNKVKWVPEHVGTNRFGKWLDGARDWAVSRQRYWGAPLPIWRNPETKEFKVFGSLAELQSHTKKSGNTYLLSRHGESEFNTKGILNGIPGVKNGLTEKGVEQTRAMAEALKKDGVDLIYYSPLERTEETAKQVAAVLGLSEEALIADDRILEMQFGEFEGKHVDEYHAFFGHGLNRLTKNPEGGENWTDVKRRVGNFLYDLENTHEGKRILIVAHNGTLQMMQAVAKGDDHETTGEHIELNDYDLINAEVRQVMFVPMPHNDNYELDFHRPYIDEFSVYDGDVRLERVPDVFDCWFESGSMPYGQHHYPFACDEKEFTKKYFPARFIAEGLDQTRGWFYSLIVLGTALFGRSPYENVIVNGLVLAEDGKKMSKSLQNYPDPMLVADNAGADAMRMYLLSSPVIRGEDLNFSEKGVLELQRKNIGRLHNVLQMYEMFADNTKASAGSEHVLDRWIIARLNEFIAESTAGYKNYELDKATRPIVDFIDDLSVWYLRRSRDRLKGEDDADKKATIATLRYILKNLSLVMAPAMPFYAEYLWGQVKAEGDVVSVHLGDWPKGGDVDKSLITTMDLVRSLATAGLNIRKQNGFNVRQPLQSFTIKHHGNPPAHWKECELLLRDELNVEEVLLVEDKHHSESGLEFTVDQTELDTNLTDTLKAKGIARDLMRAIQDMRKKAGLEPADRVALTIQTSDGGEAVVRQFMTEIQKTVGADAITFGDANGEEVTAGEHSFTIELTKV